MGKTIPWPSVRTGTPTCLQIKSANYVQKRATHTGIYTLILVLRRRHLDWWSVPWGPLPLLCSLTFDRRPCLCLNWPHPLHFPRHLPLHGRPHAPSMSLTSRSVRSRCRFRYARLLYQEQSGWCFHSLNEETSFQHLIECDSKYWSKSSSIHMYFTEGHQLCNRKPIKPATVDGDDGILSTTLFKVRTSWIERFGVKSVHNFVMFTATLCFDLDSTEAGGGREIGRSPIVGGGLAGSNEVSSVAYSVCSGTRYVYSQFNNDVITIAASHTPQSSFTITFFDCRAYQFKTSSSRVAQEAKVSGMISERFY